MFDLELLLEQKITKLYPNTANNFWSFPVSPPRKGMVVYTSNSFINKSEIGYITTSLTLRHFPAKQQSIKLQKQSASEFDIFILRDAWKKGNGYFKYVAAVA